MPDRGGDLLVRILITRAMSVLEVTGLEEAMALLDDARHRADELGDPGLSALARVQAGALHVRCTNWVAAVTELERAESSAEQLTGRERCSLYINRGSAHGALMNTAAARADLTRALDLAREHALVAQEFKARHNLAYLAFVEGDIPGALSLLQSAAEVDADVPRDRARLDHARVLLDAGLLDRAAAMLAEALTAAAQAGHQIEVGDIHLDLARCLLYEGDIALARDDVGAAMSTYRTLGASERLRSAELVSAMIDLAEDDAATAPGRFHQIARRLAQRAPSSATDLSNGPGSRVSNEDLAALRLQAEAMARAGDLVAARHLLAEATALGRAWSVADQLHESFVAAVVADGTGDVAERQRQLREANSLLLARQTSSPSLEVRAGLALHGRRLADMDVAVALHDGDVAEAFAAVERWRAASHRVGRSVEPHDPTTLRLLGELRRQRFSLGAPSVDATASAQLEREIAERDWAATQGRQQAGLSRSATLDQVLARLHDTETAVVVHLVSGSDLLAIVITAQGARVQPLAPISQVNAAVAQLGRDLGAAARITPGSPLAPAVRGACADSGERLDALLHDRLPELSTAQDVVIAPTRSLHTVPWHRLPTMHGRPLVVAPSVTRWLQTGHVRHAPDESAQPNLSIAALAGPNLARADGEVTQVGHRWSERPGTRAITVSHSQNSDLASALSEADLVHLAAHGTHEEQNPLFSAVHLYDGPTFAHELPRRPRARHIVLSACDVGLARVRPGDEPLGMTAALLSLGVTSVVASLAPVRDEDAEAAMSHYHAALASGRAAADSLAAAVAAVPGAANLCLFGSDWSANAAPTQPGDQMKIAGSENSAS